jgi:hypothetical protein
MTRVGSQRHRKKNSKYENSRRKITQNSNEVDAETKESTRKTKKKIEWKE